MVTSSDQLSLYYKLLTGDSIHHVYPYVCDDHKVIFNWWFQQFVYIWGVMYPSPVCAELGQTFIVSVAGSILQTRLVTSWYYIIIRVVYLSSFLSFT